VRRGFIYALTLVTGAALAVSAARFVATRGDNGGGGEARVPVTRFVPAAGQSFVSGEIEFLSADGIQAEPLRAPFTLSAVDRDTLGKGTIENALVDGKRTTIFWGGGTPLPLDGDGGGVDVAGSTVEVDPSGITWTLAGGRKLLPGAYHAGAPVAVGVSGLGASRDSVSFTADDRTVLNTSAGVVVQVDPQRLEVTGPGRVSARGRLTITDTAGTHSATSIDFATGPYRVVVVQQGNKLIVDATLQGPLTAT
jgi:hypothetical protein